MSLDDVAMLLLDNLNSKDLNCLSLVKKNVVSGEICCKVKRKAFGRIKKALFKSYVTELSLRNPNSHLLSESLQGFKSLTTLHLHYSFPNVSATCEAASVSLAKLTPNLKLLKISEDCAVKYAQEVIGCISDLPDRLQTVDISHLHGIPIEKKNMFFHRVKCEVLICKCFEPSGLGVVRNDCSLPKIFLDF